MSVPVTPPALSPAPAEYDQQHMNGMIFELELLVRRINELGELQGKTILLTDLPTSSAGLPTGSVWNDTGTLKIV